jgi:hypothetical protein
MWYIYLPGVGAPTGGTTFSRSSFSYARAYDGLKALLAAPPQLGGNAELANVFEGWQEVAVKLRPLRQICLIPLITIGSITAGKSDNESVRITQSSPLGRNPSLCMFRLLDSHVRSRDDYAVHGPEAF